MRRRLEVFETRFALALASLRLIAETGKEPGPVAELGVGQHDVSRPAPRGLDLHARPETGVHSYRAAPLDRRAHESSVGGRAARVDIERPRTVLGDGRGDRAR